MPRRYFQRAVARKPEFQWLGPATDTGPLPHYQGFLLGELEVRAGDHVLIRSLDSVDSLLECDVVRVLRLYEDSAHAGDKHR
jgi:hypothetical protein